MLNWKPCKYIQVASIKGRLHVMKQDDHHAFTRATSCWKQATRRNMIIDHNEITHFQVYDRSVWDALPPICTRCCPYKIYSAPPRSHTEIVLVWPLKSLHHLWGYFENTSNFVVMNLTWGRSVSSVLHLFRLLYNLLLFSACGNTVTLIKTTTSTFPPVNY